MKLMNMEHLIVFKERPPHPPSKAQMLALQNVHEEHYGKSLVNLFKNVGFDILTITYGKKRFKFITTIWFWYDIYIYISNDAGLFASFPTKINVQHFDPISEKLHLRKTFPHLRKRIGSESSRRMRVNVEFLKHTRYSYFDDVWFSPESSHCTIYKYIIL